MALDNFLYKRWKGAGYALKGALILLRTEPSIQVQAFIATCLVIAGFVFEISTTEWTVQMLAVGMVMGAEGLNTTIEAMADFMHPEFHKKIGHIKDIAAGAVFLTAIIAAVIGCIIYVPKIAALFQ